MRMKSVLFSLAAIGMAAAPVVANAAPTNPASSLSVARAGSPASHQSRFAGTSGAAGLFAIAILAGIIAIVAIGATNDDKAKSP